LASSYAKSTSSRRLFFASLDFNNGKDVFQSLGINSVPVISYLAPNTGPNAKKGKDEPDQYMPDEQCVFLYCTRPFF
jgi:hypothetical protein